VSIIIRRFREPDTENLRSAFGRLPRLPFTRDYGLPNEGSLHWLTGHFTGIGGRNDGSVALVAEQDDEVAGGLVMIPAPWETEIFEIPMARIPLVFAASPHGNVDKRVIGARLLAAAEDALAELGVRHCSALVLGEDSGLVHAFGDAGWRLVDSTLDFTWKCGRTRAESLDERRIRLRPVTDEDRPVLSHLAREAYTHSIQTRYSVDPWLPIEKTGELYTRWFELACDGAFGDVVAVAEVDGHPAGFNTFKMDPVLSESLGVGFGMHGIAAVAPELRGIGNQPAMLHWLAEWQRERGGAFNRGRVLVNNYPMQRACLKSGAFVTQSFHTFHVWLGAPPAGRLISIPESSGKPVTNGPTEKPRAVEGATPIRPDYLAFGRPDISEEEIRLVSGNLRSGWIGLGSRTLEFEKAFREYVGAEHAIAVSSCTAALHLSLLAAGIGPGDEVITTPMTFAATVNAILATGARPILVDIDPDTLNLSTEAIAEAISDRTRALLPVHFGGLPCELDAYEALAEKHGLVVIEDAAHAVGAAYRGTRIGGHGNLACFSFYPNKNMTTIEGGMVTTQDAQLADRVRLMRLHGLSSDAWKRFSSRALIASEAVMPGFKYNLTDTQSTLGLTQLARLEEFLAVRERYAALYDPVIDNLPVKRQLRPSPGGGDRHALHLYVVLLDLDQLTVGRDEVVVALRAENIGVGIHYQAIHEHPYYRELLPYRRGDLPVAESVSASTLTLPLSPGMSEVDAMQVLHALRYVLSRYSATSKGSTA
jgi:dTDP-4-amino-4,6-dideoxygalactose transaminase/GNAT superfamily N-acetyltransferase